MIPDVQAVQNFDGFSTVQAHGSGDSMSEILSLTPPAGARHLRVQAVGGDLRFTLDGSDPATDHGFLLADEALLILPVGDNFRLKVCEPAAVPLPVWADAKAFWKLADLVDATGRANTLTNNNTVTFGAGKIANAATLNGLSNYLSRAATSGSDLDVSGGSFAFAGWWKPTGDALSSGQVPLLVSCTPTGRNNYRLYTDGGNVAMKMYGEFNGEWDNVEASTPNVLALNTWAFVVAWYDWDAQRLYVQVNNGTIYSADSWLRPGYTADSQFNLAYDTGEDNYWQGQIDAVGVWKRVLTAAEREYLYNAGTGREFTLPASSTIQLQYQWSK